MLKVENVYFNYQETEVLKGINFSVSKGEIFGILGPNGSGKTTLLKLISRTMLPSDGQIIIKSKPIKQYSAKEIATLLAVLPQSIDISFSFTVEETIRMGRYAHQKGLFPKFTSDDDRILKEAMEQTNLEGFENKRLDMLSGGERQRVFLARALAQEPELLLLDEPTNHLDLSHQIKLLDSLKKWSSEKELTVIAIFHDLNLASLYCDRVLLLNQGKVVNVAQPHHALDEKMLKEIYHTSLLRHDHPTVPKPLITLLPKEGRTLKENLSDFFRIHKSSKATCIETNKPFKRLSTDPNAGGFGWSTTYTIENSGSKEYVIRTFTIGMTEVCLLASIGTGRIEPVIYVSLFINGSISEATFVRLLMVATEATTKAYHEYFSNNLIEESIRHTVRNHITIAASQQNGHIEQTLLPELEKMISKQVYDVTTAGLQNY